MHQALTFDDVLLQPQHSEALPKDIDISTKLTKNIQLNIPLLSADMDTVTEAQMAIAIARLGGLGIIHKNFSPEEQANQVEIVKRSESGIISEPITLGPQAKAKEALKIMAKYHISGIPITKNQKLVGILTNRDLRFLTDLNLKISSLMTRENLITASVGTTLKQAKKILYDHRIEKLPIVDERKNLKGLITVKDIQKIIEFPQATKDKKGRLQVGASVGIGDDALKRTELLVQKGIDLVVISTAHGDSKNVCQTIKIIKKKYPKLEIMSGNVATAEGTKSLIEAGADSIKVGVGPGSICTTRIITGAGIPQLSAIMDCAKEIKKKKVSLIADGGIRYSGDITKALAAGASAVMIGGLFAGTEESPGKLVYWQGRTYKTYRGMGSLSALKGHQGSRERYQQEDKIGRKSVPEGVEGRVIYKGFLAQVVEQLIGGLRSGMGLSGAKNFEDLQKKAKFVLVSPAGVEESHPHDIFITEEAPNYPGRIG